MIHLFAAVILTSVVNICEVKAVSKKAICGNEPVVVEFSEFTPIESPNFPAGAFPVGTNCSFILKPRRPIQNFSIVITSGIIDILMLWKDNVDNEGMVLAPQILSAFGETNFTAHRLLNSGWNAFRGYVMPDNKDGCTLPRIMEPLNDTDLQLFLPSPISPGECEFTYRASVGLGFKIFVMLLTLPMGSYFEAVNSTQHPVIKEYGTHNPVGPVLMNFLAYSDDHVLTVRYRFNSSGELLPPFFEILLGTVTHMPENMFDTCAYQTVERGIYKWSNLEPQNGYLPNTECRLNLPISNSSQLFFHFTTYELESAADYIGLVIGNGTVYPLRDVTSALRTVVPPYQGDSVEFMFHSDGSIQFIGFEMVAIVVDCECSPSTVVIPCNEEAIFGVLEDFNGYYCLGMSCFFTIEAAPNCANQYILIDAIQNSALTSWCSFALMADDVDLFNVSNVALIDNDSAVTLTFDSNADLQSLTIPADTLLFVATLRSAPAFINITLSERVPEIVFDLARLPPNAFLFVKVEGADSSSERIDVLLNVVDYMNFAFYRIHNGRFYFDYPLAYVSLGNPGGFSIYDRQFAIYRISPSDINSSQRIFLRFARMYFQHCLFETSISSLSKQTIISAIATSTGTCFLTIAMSLSLPAVHINSIWTNSDSASVCVTDLWNPTSELFCFRALDGSIPDHIYSFGSLVRFDVPAGRSLSMRRLSLDATSVLMICSPDYTAFLSFSDANLIPQFQLCDGVEVTISLLFAVNCDAKVVTSNAEIPILTSVRINQSSFKIVIELHHLMGETALLRLVGSVAITTPSVSTTAVWPEFMNIASF